MSMMGSNETDILAEATDLLDDDDSAGHDAVAKVAASPKKAAESAAGKKKVSIKRDSALPVVVA
jgi:hypothetical protein